MGNDVTEVIEALPNPRYIKVHRLMCTKLILLIERITKIFPNIEASRPRCSSGLEALCSLRNGMEKAKSLLQRCCEDSKLYLAIIGEPTLSRCEKTRNLLEQSLSYIQNNVPVILATEISPIISDLRGATFSLDPDEEEAGKAMRTFLQTYASSSDSMENTATETLRFAFLRLHITSRSALLTERRSVKRLLDNVSDVKASKKNILFYLLVLLKKHGKSVVNELPGNSNIDSLPQSNSCDIPTNMQPHSERGPKGLKNGYISGKGLPPEEYKCPISLRLMCDPVIISSGVTFEKMWVMKWFDEGHDTCPKTKTKLNDFSSTPNIAMKELISKWCVMNRVPIPETPVQSMEAQSWDPSLTSIASLSNSMNNLHLPMGFSQVSLGSLDSSNSVSLRVKDSFSSGTIKTEDDSGRFRNCQMKYVIFDKLDELSWECQCETVEDMKEQLKHDDEGLLLRAEKFVGPLIRFLKKALDRSEGKARRTATQLLLAFVSNCRSSLPNLPEEAYGLLASILDSEVTNETLAIFELLSHNPSCRPLIVESGVLYSIVGIFETQTKEFLEPAIKIIDNLSLSYETSSFIKPSDLVPKLVPLIEDENVARYCISILKNLCQNEDGRVVVAETSGCIASIAKLLDTGSDEVQENAVIVLLALCSQRVQYCRMVLEEGVIPALNFVSKMGNEKGKASAVELLRQLRDINVDETQVSSKSELDSSRDSFHQCEGQKLSSKGSWKFGIKTFFPKQSSSVSKRKK